jgi:hypothetical protein
MLTSNTKYHQLAIALKEEIFAGKFKTGEKFYTEKEIMEKFQVSSVTVAKTLNLMTQEGFFERKRKLGTFLKEKNPTNQIKDSSIVDPLYILCYPNELYSAEVNGPSWFVIEEQRRGIINSYPGAVKIVTLQELIEQKKKHTNTNVILYTGFLPKSLDYYQDIFKTNTITISFPPEPIFNSNTVSVNYLIGVYEAITCLLQLGHKKIAFVGRPEHKDRHAAYEIALHSFNMPYDPNLVLKSSNYLNENSGESIVDTLLSKDEKITAIFAGSDQLAIGIIKALQKRNINVPNDISVVGFDDSPLNKTSPIALSTVRVPYYEVGKTAVEQLLLLDNQSLQLAPKQLNSSFIKRDSISFCKNKGKNTNEK